MQNNQSTEITNQISSNFPNNKVYKNFKIKGSLHNKSIDRFFKKQGDQLYFQSRFRAAILKYEKAISLNPISPIYYYNKGLCFKKLKLFEKAIEEFDKAINLNSENYLNHKKKGISLKNIKKYENAIEEFNIAINLNPKDPSNFNNKGNVLYEMEKFEEALVEYNKAILLNPNKSIYYINKGNVYFDMQILDKALDEFIKASIINKDNNGDFSLDKIKNKITQLTTENMILKDKIELYKNIKVKLQMELETCNFFKINFFIKLFIYSPYKFFLINKIK